MKKVIDFDNYYVDENGNVYSDKSGELKKMLPHMNGKGYLTIGLRKEGKSYRKKVHRIVWEAYNGPIPHDKEINHVNEKRDDNRLENLQLMTHKENLNYGNRKKLHQQSIREWWIKNKKDFIPWNKGKRGVYHHSDETKEKIRQNSFKQWNKRKG